MHSAGSAHRMRLPPTQYTSSTRQPIPARLNRPMVTPQRLQHSRNLTLSRSESPRPLAIRRVIPRRWGVLNCQPRSQQAAVMGHLVLQHQTEARGMLHPLTSGSSSIVLLPIPSLPYYGWRWPLHPISSALTRSTQRKTD